MSYAVLTESRIGRAQAINAMSAQALLDKDRGRGEESKVIQGAFREAFNHFFVPFSTQEADPSIKFLMLKDKWKAETVLLSSITEIAMHPTYQQIIGMGLTVVPLILAEMEREPGHWFWALKSITGIDPTLPEDKGHMRRMTESWLRWGREHGYLLE